MRRMLAVTVLALAVGSTAAPAQGVKPKPDHDPLAELLFDPQLVLKFAKELSLQAAQRTAIVNAIKEAQGDILDLQLQMAERHEELLRAVEPLRVDEKVAMALSETVLGLERDLKKEQLLLLIRIKNALTPEQQDRLRAIKKATDTDGEAEAVSLGLKRLGRSPESGLETIKPDSND